MRDWDERVPHLYLLKKKYSWKNTVMNYKNCCSKIVRSSFVLVKERQKGKDNKNFLKNSWLSYLLSF
jgi:hypothetical protein